MWQKRLRLAIALFVVVFAVAVAVSLHRGQARKTAAAPPVRQHPDASIENPQGGSYQRTEQGKVTFSLKFGSQTTYPDGRTKLGNNVTIELPDKDGRSVRIDAREVNLINPPEGELSQAECSGGVKLTTSDGVTLTGAQATYDRASSMFRVPGAVAFSKGRMSGTGNGASYDLTHELLTVLDRVAVDVAPDEQGSGKTHITSATAIMARQDHYLKFNGAVHLEGEGRITDADEATMRLSADDKRIQRMELRGNARINAAAGASGPQSMEARDIDLNYAEDGRTLQTAHLMDNASVQLPGSAGASGRRVAGRTIDVTLGPDGSTVTNLTANENVQVDLPAEGDLPARRIRAASLTATGAPGVGLQSASFNGSVDYHETRAATKTAAAIERTARSERLDVQTAPGFGSLERADFHGHVHFTDGADTSADAPVAIYAVAQDRLDLTPPASGEQGIGPHVANGKITVDAARIQMTLGTQTLAADTKVKSVVQPQKRNPAPGKPARGRGAPAPVPALPSQNAGTVHMPGMLKDSEPVNVTANRLEYDGANSRATYTGNARLWQTDTVVQADKIVLDDSTGNLHATTNVRTVMTLRQAGETAPKSPPAPTTTVANELLYEDEKHKATYTTKAHMNGPDGDVTADRIELYLTEDGGELDRAEADGSVVSRQKDRRAYGDHLTYIAAKDEYTMVGKPVKVYDDAPPDCKVTVGTTLTFHKAVDTISAAGNGVAGTKTETIACGTAGRP
jgi:lipopolysaccharide export system protein LptA